ncbi:hypothetical protein [Acidovorax sp. LjRoot194]|uniref:hypothetical protein n=1 Tax=Acidovorax sp. LjRoot194 TaxID=3342280 RepID=UPI003ED103D8
MNYEFDLWGWYVGQASAAGPRTTTTPPASMSVANTAGAPRANWTGVAWVLLPYAEPPQEGTPPKSSARMSVLAFRRRFTRTEKAAIEWAAVDRADLPVTLRQQAAALRATLADQAAATFIDLSDPDTVEGVQRLAAMAIITPARAVEIITATIQPEELP